MNTSPMSKTADKVSQWLQGGEEYKLGNENSERVFVVYVVARGQGVIVGSQ